MATPNQIQEKETKIIYFNQDKWQQPMIFHAEVNQHLVSLFIDTGASVNLMSKECFFFLIRPHGVCILEPSKFQLCGVNGQCFETLGTTVFDVYIAPDLSPLKLTCYVINDPNTPADILLSNPDLARYGIDIYPHLNCIYYQQRLFHREMTVHMRILLIMSLFVQSQVLMILQFYHHAPHIMLFLHFLPMIM